MRLQAERSPTLKVEGLSGQKLAATPKVTIPSGTRQKNLHREFGFPFRTSKWRKMSGSTTKTGASRKIINSTKRLTTDKMAYLTAIGCRVDGGSFTAAGPVHTMY